MPRLPAWSAQMAQNVWLALTHGHNYDYITPLFGYPGSQQFGFAHLPDVENAVGYAKTIADRMDLAHMVPNDTAGTGHALVYGNTEYLIYQPSNSGFSVTLPARTFNREWIDPTTGLTILKDKFTAANASWPFVLPSVASALLYLEDLRITSTVRAALGNVLLQGEASPNVGYTIEASPDLSSFTSLTSVTADTSGTLSLDDSAAASMTRRFYRVRSKSVITDPAGFVTTSVAAGATAALGLPLDRFPDFVDTISGSTSNTITTTGANFGTLSSVSAPHVVRLLDGTSAGRQFKITSNTSDTLTLQTGGIDLTTVTANGDHYDVLAVETLSTFFGATADPNKPAINRDLDSTVADNVLLRGSFGYLTYYNDGANWLLVGGGSTPQNNVMLLPDQGFLFVRRAGPAISLTVTGAVPTSNLKTDLPANKTTIFPNRFPVSTTLNGLNLASIAAWKKDDDATVADNILIRGSFGWLTYYLNAAGQWRLVGGGATDQGATAISIGASFLAVRRPGSTVTLDQPLPYNLN